LVKTVSKPYGDGNHCLTTDAAIFLASWVFEVKLNFQCVIVQKWKKCGSMHLTRVIALTGDRQMTHEKIAEQSIVTTATPLQRPWGLVPTIQSPRVPKQLHCKAIGSN